MPKHAETRDWGTSRTIHDRTLSGLSATREAIRTLTGALVVVLSQARRGSLKLKRTSEGGLAAIWWGSSRLWRDGLRLLVLAFAVVALALATAPVAPTSAATFTVRTIGDDPDAVPGNGVCATAGAVCTLRAAIQEANALAGADAINFSIPPSGAKTIAPLSALPAITEAVTIDGTTQPGFAGSPIIELNGAGAGAGANGIAVTAGTGSTVKGLVINNFNSSGILIQSVSGTNTVQGNYIGANLAGTAVLGNGGNGVSVLNGSPNNVIGGTAAGARNIISGNLRGVLLTGNANAVAGNYIGTDVTGTADLGNSNDGVIIATASATNSCIGGVFIGPTCTPSVAAGNVISGNNTEGIEVGGASSSGNQIVGNFIGLQADGVTALGNTDNGIEILGGASNTTIGGNRANRIAFNGGDGVFVAASNSTGNAIQANSIYSNGASMLTLGIDLGTNGVTPNDAGDPDTGANNLQNFPVLTAASSAGGQTAVVGTLNSTASTTFFVDFYHNATCDASGHGEGEVWFGRTDVTTNASGNASIIATSGSGALVGSVAAGRFVTATATHAGFPPPPPDTSEFSNCVEVTGNTSSFRPLSSTSLSTATLGAHPDTTTTFDFPMTPDALASNGYADTAYYFPALAMSYTDGSFTIAPDAAITNGASVGSFQTTVDTLGFANEGCNQVVPLSTGPLREADTNTADTIAPGGPPDPLAPLVADNRGANPGDPPNGLPDYLDATPTFNNTIFTPAGSVSPITPRARYVGNGSISIDTETRITMLQIVVFDPGALSGTANGGWSASALGYPTVAVIGDPTAGPTDTNKISDSCSPSQSNVFLCGSTDTDLATGGCQAGVGTQTRLTSPAATRTVQTIVQTKSLRDLDNDAIESRLDVCYDIPNPNWDPRQINQLSGSDADGDGLPAACDPNDALANADMDGDGWPNRLDNCPLVVNGAGQLDQDIASNAAVPDGGPRSDSIGAACDADPGTPNGHYHRTAIVYRNCITNNPAVDDTDGDGVCRTGPAGALIDPNDNNVDSDGDNVTDTTDDCVSVPNFPPLGFTQVDYDMDGVGDPCDSDVDGDGWSNSAETTIGTDPLDPCADNTRVSAWPADINNDTFSDISDVSALTGVFGQSVPPAPARYDIAPDVPDGFVDITDISRMVALFGQSCGTLYGTTTGPP